MKKYVVWNLSKLLTGIRKSFFFPGFQGSGFLGSKVFKVRVQILKVAVSHFTLVGFFQ